MKNKIIAFIGPDGSGKSTAIEYASFILKKKKIKFKVVYPFNYFVLRKIINFLSNKKKKIYNYKSFKKKGVIKFLFPILALIDAWLFFFFKIKPFNGYVLCDRYYDDLYTAYQEFNYGNSYINLIFLKLTPKANIRVLLINTKEKLMEREKNGKHSLSFFKRQISRYNKLKKQNAYISLKKNFSRNDIFNIIND